MLCPECGKHLLVESAGQAEFWFCRDCCGMWLSMDQLSAIARGMGAITLPEGVAELRHHYSGDGGCPVCGQPLKVFEYAYDSGAMVHRCDECLSLWAGVEDIVMIGDYLKASAPRPGDGNLAGACSKSWWTLVPTEDDQDALDYLKGIGVEIVIELVLGLLD